MCVLLILGALVFIVLIRYLWWLDSYGDVNPYMQKGEAMAATPLTSDEAKGEPSSTTDSELKPSKEPKLIEMIEVDTAHKELVKVEEESPSDKPQKPSFLKEPNGEKDDLKKISGIGPKIEEKLNNLGIFHYQQIADFSQETIHWVDEHLSFHGRIERDDWMGQATLLAKGEDTEFSKRYK